MATFLLYLGPCLGLYSILVMAGSGGVYIYSCCSYCGCCGVAEAAIKIAGGVAIGVVSGAAIRTTNSAAVGIASGIGGAASRISGGFCRHC